MLKRRMQQWKKRRLRLETSEWTRRQPVAAAPVALKPNHTHTLRIEKTAGRGGKGEIRIMSLKIRQGLRYG